MNDTERVKKPFKSTYSGLKDTKEEQLKDAAESIQIRLADYFAQWGIPLKRKSFLVSIRNFKAPLAEYKEFIEYIQVHGYVEFLANMRGHTYLLPGGLNLTKAQKLDALIKADEIEFRIKQNEAKWRR